MIRIYLLLFLLAGCECRVRVESRASSEPATQPPPREPVEPEIPREPVIEKDPAPRKEPAMPPSMTPKIPGIRAPGPLGNWM